MIFDKIIFLHIPKTAGSSIINSFKENYILLEKGDEKFFNKTNPSIREIYKDFKLHLPIEALKLSNKYNDKPIIAFVRNPFSRAVSLFHQCLDTKDYREFLNINEKTSFYEFLDKIEKKNFWFTMPMIDWIGVNNLQNIDYIGNFENFINDCAFLKKKFNLDFKIKHHNKNSILKSKLYNANYLSFYDDSKNIQKIENIYQKDLHIFNYDFEKFKKYENDKNKIINLIKNYLKRKIL
jgi:hypothetical protein